MDDFRSKFVRPEVDIETSLSAFVGRPTRSSWRRFDSLPFRRPKFRTFELIRRVCRTLQCRPFGPSSLVTLLLTLIRQSHLQVELFQRETIKKDFSYPLRHEIML